MEDNDKENLLMAEADEEIESQTEEVSEEKRDDKVIIDDDDYNDDNDNIVSLNCYMGVDQSTRSLTSRKLKNELTRRLSTSSGLTWSLLVSMRTTSRICKAFSRLYQQIFYLYQ